MKYNNYLKSGHWKKTRSSYYQKKEKVCRICGNDKNINLHHRQYRDNDGNSILYKEKIYQLYALCGRCHTLWHTYHGRRKTKLSNLLRARRLYQNGVDINKAIFLCCGQGDAYAMTWKAIKKKKKIINHGLYRGGESQGNTGDQTTDRPRASQFL